MKKLTPEDERLDVRYYGAMSYIFNVWREEAVDVCLNWKDLPEPFNKDAAKHTKGTPPQCLAMRWGYVGRCERKLAGTPRESLYLAMKRTLDRHGPTKGKGRGRGTC